MDPSADEHALAALRASEERLQRALRVAHVGSWEWDVVADTLFWTDELFEIFGVEPEDFEASYVAYIDRVHPDDRTRVDAAVRASMESGEPFVFDHRVLRADGNERILHARGEVVRDENGCTIKMVGTGQDVTEARQREAALAETERQLLVAQRLSKSGTWRYDINTGMSEWSAEMFRLYDLEPTPGPQPLEVLLANIDPADAAMLRYRTLRAAETGEGWSADVHVRTATGETRIVWGTAEVEFDEHGKAVCIRGTRQDVTEVRHNEQRLRESEERAQLASRQKSQFLANMSHEIRTPLNGVIGMTELLADSALAPTQREHVNALHSAAKSLVHLLNDILDVSKIEAGKVTVETMNCDLPALIAETTALFKVAGDTKGVELRSVIDESTPQWVRIDPARVKQILGNLVGNGLKFTERGTVSLAVGRDDDRLRFTVTDTGIGIAAEDQERLMSPFEQGDASTTRRFGGTGLGLAISRDLAELMGGTITFTSKQNVGTTFVVELPYAPGAAPEPCTVPVASPHAPRTGGRVLLAEDTPVNQLVARAMLEKSGWTVEIVENGQQALNALARDTFDVVILDCQMPVLDGFSAARAIRDMPLPASAVPILAMTASALPEDRKRCLDAGMDEYLTKPISRAALDLALERVLATPRAAMIHG